MHILVTGADGYIGKHLVHRLLSDGHQVTAMSRSRRAGSRVATVQCDLLKPEDWEDAFPDILDFDAVFHLGTYALSISTKVW